MRKMRVKIIALTIVSVVALFGLLATSSNPSSGQEQRAPTGRTTAHLLCCGFLVNVPGTWMGHDRRCVEYLQNAPQELQTQVCKGLEDRYVFLDIPENAACIKEMAPICPAAKCEKYTGEITCDCDGDGKDESTKSFESCSLPRGTRVFNKSFKSRCEDGIRSRYDGPGTVGRTLGYDYEYPTHPDLVEQIEDWLEPLWCPSLRCKIQNAVCEGRVDHELELCKFDRGSFRCEREAAAARKNCTAAHDRCLKNARRSGPTPPPRPQPLPAPTRTPTPPWFRPTSSRIFGSGPLTNPSVAVLPGLWTKACIGLQLESNL